MEKEGVVVVEVESGGQLKYMYLFLAEVRRSAVIKFFPSNRRHGKTKEKRIVYRLQLSGKSKFKLSCFNQN